jgi:hypothetical protein
MHTTRFPVYCDLVGFDFEDSDLLASAVPGIRETSGLMTLSQEFAPLGNRTTGMMEAPQRGRSSCHEEEQVH